MRLIAWPWVTGWAPRERQWQLPLKFHVVGGLLLAPSSVTHCSSSQGTVELFTCPLSRALTSVTQFHCTTTTAYIITDRNWWWQAASVHFSDADWSEYGAWWYWLSHTRRPSAAASPLYLLSVLSLFRRQPWNLKPLHSCCCGHFREAQSAD